LTNIYVSEYGVYRSPLRSTPHMIHTLNGHYPRSAEVHNSFALTVCLEVVLWQNIRIDNRKSLFFNYPMNADMKRKLKLKISNVIC